MRLVKMIGAVSGGPMVVHSSIPKRENFYKDPDIITIKRNA